MYAVIETGGKQYKISEGDVITIEKLDSEVNAEVEFNKVLLLGNDGDIQIGTPYLDAARVFGTVLESGKGKKIVIFKYKSKKDYRKKQGHRQPYTMVQIDSISPDGKKTAKKAAPKKEETPVTAPVEAVGAEEPAVEKKSVAPKKAVSEEKTEKKQTAKKTSTEDKDKAETEKKPAAKKTTKSADGEAISEKKPAAKKNAAKKEAAEEVVTAEKVE